MIVGMSMVPPPPPAPRTRRRRRSAPATNIFGQPVDFDRNANVGRAIAGSFLNLFDVPVQAIGGMYRDVVQGTPTGGQSAGSRALQNYGEQVQGLVSDIGRPGRGGTPFFQPREFEAAGEAAVDRFGLEGAGASAVRGGSSVLDLLTGLGAGGVGAVGGRAASTAGRAGVNVASMTPAQRQLYLNSISGRLFHGSKDRNPFSVSPEGGNVSENIFNTNFFATPSRALAETPGYGAGYSHRVGGLTSENVRNMNILDLMPGAPSVRDQFPNIVNSIEEIPGLIRPDDLAVVGSQNITKDLGALNAALNNPTRYFSFSKGQGVEGMPTVADIYGREVPSFGRWLNEQGIDAIRHQSGWGVGGSDELYEPVFAFFNPQNMVARPSINFDRALENVSDSVRQGFESIGPRFRSLLNRLRNREAPYDPRFDEL